MGGKDARGLARGPEAAEAARGWLLAALALLAVLLYAAALFGWLKPLADERWVAHAEPVVLLVVGYYLGRLPTRRVEAAFNEALNRQAQKTDAAQHAKEQAQQAREVLEERAKNAALILAAATRPTPGGLSARAAEGARPPQAEDALRRSIATALSVLDS